jgi:hypothetical protein
MKHLLLSSLLLMGICLSVSMIPTNAAAHSHHCCHHGCNHDEQYEGEEYANEEEEEAYAKPSRDDEWLNQTWF